MSEQNASERISERAEYQCRLCNANFSSKDALEQHYQGYHMDRVAIPLVKCPECGKSFESGIEMDRHMKEEHNIRPVKDKTTLT
ncbi:MAG: DNA-directed RNA polymerase subunit RPC12/RpoP [Candidatus Nitrosomirales archaeon]|jgi:DNA-directed RNA polymerase subunit RPC12/RpoP